MISLPLHVEELGSEGRPLVLVHGFGAHSYTWRYWVPPLAEDHRVVLVDLKGHGSAPKPRDRAYGPLDQVELLVRMVRGRDLRELTLVGHSMGGGIALLTALRLLDEDPERLRSLVVVSGAAFPQEIPRYIGLARIRGVGELLLLAVPSRTLVRRVLRSIVHDPDAVSRAQVEAYARPLMSGAGRHAILESARQILPPNLDDLVARYPEIRVPTLLLWGRDDGITPPWIGERLERTLPASRLVQLDACGHVPQEERPEESLRAVRDFLRREG